MIRRTQHAAVAAVLAALLVLSVMPAEAGGFGAAQGIRGSVIAVLDSLGITEGGVYTPPPRVLAKSATETQTGANTDETTLWSYSLPAGTLAQDGQGVRVTVFGRFAANANSKTVRMKFGATQLVSRGTTSSGVRFAVEAVILRSGASAQVAWARASFGTDTGSFGQNTTTPAEALSGAAAIAVTGQNASASAGDIVFLGAVVEMLP